MSDHKKVKRKGNAHAAASPQSAAPAAATPAAPPSADALLELIGSRIDSLEVASGNPADSPAPTADEKASVHERVAALRAAIDPAVAATPAVAAVLTALQEESLQRVVLSRQLSSSSDRVQRAGHQKKSLENLCRELQTKNAKLAGEVRALAGEQAEKHAEMQRKFTANLDEIQSQINKHSSERLAQAAENDKLRAHLGQLLEYDKAREEHFAQQTKTKELELKLSEAKLAQQADFAAQEVAKGKAQAERIEYLQQVETALRAQLETYSQKFTGVQETLTKSNELFASFKSELEKTASALRKAETEKLGVEKSYAQSKLQLLQMSEAKMRDEKEMEALRRKVETLTKLCKTLQAKAAGAPASENDAAASNAADATAVAAASS